MSANVALQELLGLSNYACDRLANRIADLTDEEYFWEPVADSWSIRKCADGKYEGDWGLIFDEAPPVTTIAWRLSHIIDLLSEERCATWIGLEPEPEDLFADGQPGNAQAARDLLDKANARWQRYVTATDVAKLFDQVGPISPGFADSTRFAFILHIVDELIHHAAEVALLRDLYRAERDHDPAASALFAGERPDQSEIDRLLTKRPHLVLEAVATGHWDAVPLLIELGFGIDGKNGRTPLHHAAADGRLETIQLLIDAGSDLNARDPVYNVKPIAWAEFFNRNEAAAFLKRAYEDRKD